MSTRKQVTIQPSRNASNYFRRTKLFQYFRCLVNWILKHIVCLIHLAKDTVLDQFFGWYWSDKRKPCPALGRDQDFLSFSAVDLADMIRNREITSFELVHAYTQRILAINPVLNAIIDGPFDEALAEARTIDEKITNEEFSENDFIEKPFLGIPFSTKDSTAVKGKLNTLGLVSRKTTIAKEDAECVRLMRQAGAIILVTSSVPEINLWQETRNNIIGQTNNPYDTRRMVGGSSGGEAVLVAACGSAFGVGTDIGGSIRMPAFCCGVFGHKPTTGTVNLRGCSLRTGREGSTMLVVGPIARYARDLLPIFMVLAGPKNVVSLKLDETVDVKRLKYYYITQNGEWRSSPVTCDLQVAMTKVVKHIAEIAHIEPKKARLAGTEHSFKMWRYWMYQEPGDRGLMLGGGVHLNFLAEFVRKLSGNSEFTAAALISLFDDQMMPKDDADRMRELTRKCDEELTNLLGDDGILLYPSMPIPAPFHYAPLLNIFNSSLTGLFNVLHVPSTQVPLGLNASGVPLGIQVVATRNRDRHCLAVARELERAFRGWVPPFKV